MPDQRPGDRCRRPERSAPDSKPAPKPAAPPGAVAKEPHADRNRQEPDCAWYGLSRGTTPSSGKPPDDTMGDIFIKRSKTGRHYGLIPTALMSRAALSLSLCTNRANSCCVMLIGSPP